MVGISENGVSFGGEEGGLRIKDFKPQLLDENQEVIFDGDYFSSSDVYHHHRVNGPAWDSMLSSLKTTNESNFANAIIDKTSYDYNSIFSYDATGTTFINTTTYTQLVLRTESNAIDLSSTYDISGLTGTAPHTIIATFNINATAVNLHHVIVGYGTGSYHGDKFALRVSSNRSFGGDASGGVYVLGLWCGGAPDFWLDSNIGIISTGVETTAAVSWDGMNTYLFLKNSSTGQWVMDSNAEPGTNTGTAYGLMIGAMPISATHVDQLFNGTIGQVTVYDFAVTTIDNIEKLFWGKTGVYEFKGNTTYNNALHLGEVSIQYNGVDKDTVGEFATNISQGSANNLIDNDSNTKYVSNADANYGQIAVNRNYWETTFNRGTNDFENYNVILTSESVVDTDVPVQIEVIDLIDEIANDYKIKVIGSGSNSYVIIAEIKLQNINNGQYITLTNPTASSIFQAANSADKAIDGNLGTALALFLRQWKRKFNGEYLVESRCYFRFQCFI